MHYLSHFNSRTAEMEPLGRDGIKKQDETVDILYFSIKFIPPTAV
jgi:hypothetical protein